jgi:RND family efflux transporter MFP subunit
LPPRSINTKPTPDPSFLLLVALLIAFLATSVNAQGMRVITRALSEVAISTQGRAPATVMATNRSVIAAEVNGVVASIEVDVAEQVSEGQLLLQIEVQDFQLKLDLARAGLKAQDARIDQARKRLQRARDLNNSNFASVDDLHARETELAVLKADREGQVVAVAQAMRARGKTQISAPFAGTVYSRAAQKGAYVSPGMPLLTLVQTDSFELEGELDPSDAKSLAASERIVFSRAGQEWPVELVRLSMVVGERSQVQKARLKFTAGAPVIGSTGYLVWQIAQLAVPADLLVKRGEQLGLFVVDGQTARFVPLENAQEGRPVKVSLPATSQVITGGRDRVEDGDSIIVDS